MNDSLLNGFPNVLYTRLCYDCYDYVKGNSHMMFVMMKVRSNYITFELFTCYIRGNPLWYALELNIEQRLKVSHKREFNIAVTELYNERCSFAKEGRFTLCSHEVETKKIPYLTTLYHQALTR